MWLLLLSSLLIYHGVVLGAIIPSEELQPQDETKSIISSILLKSLLKIYAPTTSSNEKCRAHSLQYAEGVGSFQMWAIKMFDSSTKLPDGIIAGMINQLGNFDECVGVAAPDEGHGTFRGQHCYVRLQPGPAGRGQLSGSQLPVALRDHMERQFNISREQSILQARSGIPLPAGVGFHWSFCVPSSCSAGDVSAHFTQVLGFLGVTAVVSEGGCNTSERPPLTAGDWTVIALIIVLLTLAALSTAYDISTTDSESRRPLLLSFSIQTNGARLFDISSTGSETLTALNGIRFLSISWVVYCHEWMIAVLYPSINIESLYEFLGDHSREYILNGSLSVDSFFLLSGTLLCYIFLKEMARGTSFNLPLFYLHRYLRLTPPVIAMILFYLSFADKLGSGPVWSTTKVLSNGCRENWWMNLLYIQNYYLMERVICVMQTWYLAADMQLFLLSPLVLYPLWKWPKVGKVILTLAFLAGVSSSYTAHYFKKTRMIAVGSDPWTHTRTTVWLIGIGLGFLLHHTKSKRPQLSKITVCVLWALALFLTIGIVYLPASFRNSDYEYVQGVDALWVALFRPLFGLGLAIIIFCCVHGYGGPVNSFLSWKVFIPLARLSYGIYLTHMSVQFGLMAVMRSPKEVTDSVVVPRFFSNMVVSTGFAVILALLVEIPCINIEKSLISTGSSAKKNKGLA